MGHNGLVWATTPEDEGNVREEESEGMDRRVGTAVNTSGDFTAEDTLAYGREGEEGVGSGGPSASPVGEAGGRGGRVGTLDAFAPLVLLLLLLCDASWVSASFCGRLVWWVAASSDGYGRLLPRRPTQEEEEEEKEEEANDVSALVFLLWWGWGWFFSVTGPRRLLALSRLFCLFLWKENGVLWRERVSSSSASFSCRVALEGRRGWYSTRMPCETWREGECDKDERNDASDGV